jgi:DNA ligase 1
MNFKPMLCPNEKVDLETIKYPVMASYKLDGIRCIFHPQLGIISRSLKPIVNKQLKEKFKHILDFCENKNIILDGEIYSHDLTFQEITSFVMTKDLEDPKTVKKNKGILKIPESLKYYCFDSLLYHRLDTELIPFETRSTVTANVVDEIQISIIHCSQYYIDNPDDVDKMFNMAIHKDYEGLILKDPQSPYKFGRATINQGYCYKVKPFKTFDAQIKNVQQATEVDPAAEKKTNELGRSVTSKKKGDRVLIEKASAFIVEYGSHDLKVSLAMTDSEKEEVWKNKESYIGRVIEYKGMMVGSKDVPRHPVMVRFRDDKT